MDFYTLKRKIMTDNEFDKALYQIYLKGLLNRFDKEYLGNEVKITLKKDVFLRTK